MKKKHPSPTEPCCPCGSGLRLEVCCGRFHEGEAASDAEALMRSRYSAFVLAEDDYVRATWHASTRPEGPDLAPADGMRWLGLEVKRHELTGEGSAIVEFVARYKIGGRAYRMHETSRFVREEGRWYYVDGVVHSR